MAWTDVKLSPFKDVLKRQPPFLAGQPFHMQPYTNDLPKSVGDPWHGAYSKHGFWYKFRFALKADYDYITARSIENNSNFLLYESFDLCSKYGTTFLIAENQRNEIIGCVSKTNHEGQIVLGSYFVDANYRHSGIGLKLMKEAMNDDSLDYIFYSPSHLLNKIHSKLGLNPQGDTRTIYRVILDDIQQTVSNEPLSVVNDEKRMLELSELHKILKFDAKICGFNREEYSKSFLQQKSVKSRICCDENSDLSGLCVGREVEHKEIRQLWIGPWYAADEHSAENVLLQCLHAFKGNVEIHFLIPKMNSRALAIVSKLNGNMRIERIGFQACSTRKREVDLSNVFGVGDLNTQLL